MWVIALAAVLLACFRHDRARFLLSSLLLFQFVWMMVSVTFIEANEGLLLVSTWSVAADVGASGPLFVLLAAFLAGTFLIPRLPGCGVGSDMESSGALGGGGEQRRAGAMGCVVVAAAAYSLANALLSPNVLTGSGDVRAAFYSTSRLPFASELNIATPTILVLAGKLEADEYRRRGTSSGPAVLALALSLASTWLSGVEFSGYIQLLFSFFIVVLVRHSASEADAVRDGTRRGTRRVVFFGILGAVAAAGYKVLQLVRSGIYGGVTASGFGRFLYRALALQGEVFWRVYSRSATDPDRDQLVRELEVLLLQRPKQESGIYVLMAAIVPASATASSYTLNSGFPAILVYIFGYGPVCIAASFLCGLLFGLVLRALELEIRLGSVLGLALSFGFMFALFLAFSMGGTLYVASTAGIVTGAGYLIVRIVRSGMGGKGHASQRGHAYSRGVECV